MKNTNKSRSVNWRSMQFGLLIFLVFSCQYDLGIPQKKQTLSEVTQKQKGVHLFGKIDSSNLKTLIHNNVEWTTVVTWGNQDDYFSPIITHFNTTDSLQIVGYTARLRKRIEQLHANGFKVFFKPHLWINNPSNRTRRSDILPSNEKDWELWQNSYREFIISCAKLAEQTKVEMFCIGTELTKLSTGKPLFWRTLIKEIRAVYSGKITYAANWYREFESISFWDELDYVGIQAYFPLVKNKNPTVEQISQAWDKHFPSLEAIHKKYNRKILFTEMGYKSTADSAIEPWKWVENIPSKDKNYSMETQANCYDAFFNVVWPKEWFAGVHIWEFRGDYIKREGRKDLGFSPQGKSALHIIKKGFE